MPFAGAGSAPGHADCPEFYADSVTVVISPGFRGFGRGNAGMLNVARLAALSARIPAGNDVTEYWRRAGMGSKVGLS